MSREKSFTEPQRSTLSYHPVNSARAFFGNRIPIDEALGPETSLEYQLLNYAEILDLIRGDEEKPSVRGKDLDLVKIAEALGVSSVGNNRAIARRIFNKFPLLEASRR